VVIVDKLACQKESARHHHDGNIDGHDGITADFMTKSAQVGMQIGVRMSPS